MLTKPSGSQQWQFPDPVQSFSFYFFFPFIIFIFIFLNRKEIISYSGRIAPSCGEDCVLHFVMNIHFIARSAVTTNAKVHSLLLLSLLWSWGVWSSKHILFTQNILSAQCIVTLVLIVNILMHLIRHINANVYVNTTYITGVKDSETLWAFRQSHLWQDFLAFIQKSDSYMNNVMSTNYNPVIINKKRKSLLQIQINTFLLRSLHSLNVVQTTSSENNKTFPILISCKAINAVIII